MPFRFKSLEIPEVALIEPQVFEDHRGFFMETYKWSVFEANGIPHVFMQDNYSHSIRGVLRGLHYQRRLKAQGKMVKVLRGEIFDVAVDIRRGSPTYGRWVGAMLSDKNRLMLYIPVGFAHGFSALSDEADVLYKVTAEYAPDYERGILWSDPEIGIQWPIQTPLLSPADAQLPRLKEADNDFVHEGGSS